MTQEGAPTTRAAIVQAVVDRLKGLDLEFEQKVFPHRARPFWPKNLPGCAVYSLREASELANVAPRRYARKLELQVELVVQVKTPKPDSGTLDEVDALCGQVVEQLERDATLDGLVEDLHERSWEFDLVNEGAEYFGFATLTYEVSYWTEQGEQPQGGFDSLRKVDVEVDAQGAKIEAEIRTEVLS